MTKVYDNSGSLRKNARKEKPTHADVKGSATINGVEYWISGWQKDGDNGKWYSLSFEPKGDKPQREKPTKPPSDFDDEPLPF